MPTISIILPTHNGARFIRRAIESVRQQQYKDWELIIINDGSTDATGALITEIASIDPRIRIIPFRTNKGIQKALNEGLLQSRGEYIARIDDDDVWTDATKLSKQLTFFEEHPDHVLLGTGIIVQDQDGNELYRFYNPETDAAIRQRILYRNCISHSSAMFRKSAAMHFNGYSEQENVRHMEDYDLWLKLGTIGKMANLSEYLVRFSSHPGTISTLHKREQLRRQLHIAALFKSQYPHYAVARIKSYLRLVAYTLFGRAVPARLLDRVLKWYKQS